MFIMKRPQDKLRTNKRKTFSLMSKLWYFSTDDYVEKKKLHRFEKSLN